MMQKYEYGLGRDYRVIDGDTIEATLICTFACDIGFGVTQRIEAAARVKLRLARIYAPEKDAPSTAALQSLLDTHIGTGIVVSTKKSDKYGRYLVELDVLDGPNINSEMLRLGHATTEPLPKE
mgnify:FL=1